MWKCLKEEGLNNNSCTNNLLGKMNKGFRCGPGIKHNELNHKMNKVSNCTTLFDPAFTLLTCSCTGRTNNCPFKPNKQFCTLITLPDVNLNN